MVANLSLAGIHDVPATGMTARGKVLSITDE
jgi:hypothetical protein